MSGGASVWKLFFNVTCGNDFLHGILCTAPVHMGGCLSNCYQGTDSVGKYKSWMPMFAPV